MICPSRHELNKTVKQQEKVFAEVNKKIHDEGAEVLLDEISGKCEVLDEELL